MITSLPTVRAYGYWTFKWNRNRKETKDMERPCFQMKSRNLQDIGKARNHTLLVNFLSPERTVVLVEFPYTLSTVVLIWDSKIPVKAFNQQWNCSCFAGVRNKAPSWSSLPTGTQLSQQQSQNTTCVSQLPNPQVPQESHCSLSSLEQYLFPTKLLLFRLFHLLLKPQGWTSDLTMKFGVVQTLFLRYYFKLI